MRAAGAPSGAMVEKLFNGASRPQPIAFKTASFRVHIRTKRSSWSLSVAPELQYFFFQFGEIQIAKEQTLWNRNGPFNIDPDRIDPANCDD